MNSVEQLQGTRHEYRLKGYSALPVLLAVVIAGLVPWIYFVDGMVPAALAGVLFAAGGFALGLQQSRLILTGA